MPWTPCVNSFLGFTDLKTGMIILSIIILVLCVVPIGILLLMCDEHELVIHHQITYYNIIAVVLLAVIMLIVMCGEEVTNLCHLIMMVLWWIITIATIAIISTLVSMHYKRFYEEGICGIGFFLGFLCYVGVTVALLCGVVVYWSFFMDEEEDIGVDVIIILIIWFHFVRLSLLVFICNQLVHFYLDKEMKYRFFQSDHRVLQGTAIMDLASIDQPTVAMTTDNSDK
ncbi:hypothetical protein M8J76_004904 [Diaphorina citri]|nr:hypothetical protein M8J76_004904 [Diaphorina citri]KAI5751116.1 hypothetical protein M8J77_004394 [Diaphorina citri]